MPDIMIPVRVEVDLDAYKSFFDHEWAREFDKFPGAKLNELAFDLCMAWKGAALTAYVPWLMMNSMKTFAATISAEAIPNHRLVQLVTVFSEQLTHRLSLSSTVKGDIQKAMLDLEQESRERLDKMTFAYPVATIWDDLVKLPEFQLTLWASQRICYSAIYHAYEDFLVQCVRIHRGDPDYRMKKADVFKQEFKDAFGDVLKQTCWTDRPVDVARCVRHALSHNGGRETEELRNRKPHGFEVLDDRLQITAVHVKGVFDELKERAMALAKYASTLSAFH